MENSDVKKLVSTYPTEYEMGFISHEIETFLNENFPQIDKDKLSEAIGVVTALTTKDGTVIYHTDIYYAIVAVLENRDLNSFEID